ncbi:dehalogenase [Dehalobacter sp. MCB1]|nr:dehalogenase [Dehalobacter sp. MCB1]TCX54844.1 dehalogenase [Dehalobacter sp. 12DCB1]
MEVGLLGVFLVFVAGIAFLAGILALKPFMKRENKIMTVLNWSLYVIWYLITCTGISFVFLNSRVGHVKATSTGIFLFFGLSVIFAVILARLLGLLGKNGLSLMKQMKEAK